MSRTLKNTLIIAAAVALIGLIIGIVGFLFGGMEAINIGPDGIKLASESNSKEFDETYTNIAKIDADLEMRDVEVKSGTEFRVQSKGVGEKFSATNENGTLKITDNPKGSWFNFNIFGFTNEGSEHADLIITCPADKIDDLDIDTDSGNIDLTNIKAQSIKLNTDFGDTKLENVHANTANLTLDSGSMDIKKSNINTIKFEMSFGDFDATNLISQSIEGNLDSGSAEIEGTINGPVTITAAFGDVDLTLTGKENSHSYDLATDFGDIDLNGNESSGSIIKEYDNKPKIKLELDSGSISIRFK